jgi:hypothetical protein
MDYKVYFREVLYVLFDLQGLSFPIALTGLIGQAGRLLPTRGGVRLPSVAPGHSYLSSPPAFPLKTQ